MATPLALSLLRGSATRTKESQYKFVLNNLGANTGFTQTTLGLA